MATDAEWAAWRTGTLPSSPVQGLDNITEAARKLASVWGYEQGVVLDAAYEVVEAVRGYDGIIAAYIEAFEATESTRERNDA